MYAGKSQDKAIKSNILYIDKESGKSISMPLRTWTAGQNR